MEQAEKLPQSVGLTGRYIAAISDADFSRLHLQDGKLPKRDVNLVDRLSIITLPSKAGQTYRNQYVQPDRTPSPCLS